MLLTALLLDRSLHIRLVRTNVLLPKMHRISSEVDLESSRSPAKSELEQSQSTMLHRITHMTILSVVTHVTNVGYQKRANRLSLSRVHYVTAVASLFTNLRMSSPPILAKYKNFKTICEHTSDNAPTVCSSSFFEVMVVKTWCRDLNQLLIVFVCQNATSFNHVLPYHKTKRLFLRQVSPNRVTFSVAPAEIRKSNIFVCSSTMFSFDLQFTLITTQIHVINERCRFSRINQLDQFLPRGTQILLSSSHFDVIHVIPMRTGLECFRFLSPTISWQVGTGFVQEEPQGLQFDVGIYSHF